MSDKKNCRHIYTITSEGNMVCTHCYHELLKDNPQHKKELENWKEVKEQVFKDTVWAFEEALKESRKSLDNYKKTIEDTYKWEEKEELQF